MVKNGIRWGASWGKAGLLAAILLLAPFAALVLAPIAPMAQEKPYPILPTGGFRVTGFSYTVGNDTLHMRVDVLLPNPCYRVSEGRAVLDGDRIVLEAVVKPPAPGSICIQVIATKTLSYSMPLPPPGSYPAFLRVMLPIVPLSSSPGAPGVWKEIYLGVVTVPAGGQTGAAGEEGLAPYRGLLLDLVGAWEEARGYWLYRARVEGMGTTIVALPLEITGGLPAGFAGRGYLDTLGNDTLVVLVSVTVSK